MYIYIYMDPMGTCFNSGQPKKNWKRPMVASRYTCRFLWLGNLDSCFFRGIWWEVWKEKFMTLFVEAEKNQIWRPPTKSPWNRRWCSLLLFFVFPYRCKEMNSWCLPRQDLGILFKVADWDGDDFCVCFVTANLWDGVPQPVAVPECSR